MNLLVSRLMTDLGNNFLTQKIARLTNFKIPTIVLLKTLLMIIGISYVASNRLVFIAFAVINPLI